MFKAKRRRKNIKSCVELVIPDGSCPDGSNCGTLQAVSQLWGGGKVAKFLVCLEFPCLNSFTIGISACLVFTKSCTCCRSGCRSKPTLPFFLPNWVGRMSRRSSSVLYTCVLYGCACTRLTCKWASSRTKSSQGWNVATQSILCESQVFPPHPPLGHTRYEECWSFVLLMLLLVN